MFWRNLFIDYPGRYLFVIRDHWEGINFMDYSVLMHVVNKASPIVFFFFGFLLGWTINAITVLWSRKASVNDLLTRALYKNSKFSTRSPWRSAPFL